MKYFISFCAAITLTAMGASTMAEGNDVASAITQRLHWPLRSDIREVSWKGLEGCFIYSAYDRRAHDAAGVIVAKLRDGSLIFSSDPNALNKVFSSCLSPSAPATTLAKLMLGFSRNAGMVVLAEGNSPLVAINLLKKAGREFTVPEISVEGEARVIKFFALSPDGSTLFEVKGRIGNPISVEAKRLAGTY